MYPVLKLIGCERMEHPYFAATLFHILLGANILQNYFVNTIFHDPKIFMNELNYLFS